MKHRAHDPCMSSLHPALSRDVVSQIQSVLPSRRLMALSYDEFVSATKSCDELFSTWIAKVAEFTELMRQIQKKKPHESIAKVSDVSCERGRGWMERCVWHVTRRLLLQRGCVIHMSHVHVAYPCHMHII